MFVRDRIDRLLDPGSPFLEIAPARGARALRRLDPLRRHRDRHRPRQRPRVRDRRQRRDREGRHLLPDHRAGSTCARRTSRSRTACPASTSSIPAARSCRARTTCSPTASTSAASSTTRRRCRRAASRSSRWSWAPARQAAPTCRPCATSPSSCASRARSSSAARRWCRPRPASAWMPRRWAAATCTRGSRASWTTWPTTTRTRCGWRDGWSPSLNRKGSRPPPGAGARAALCGRGAVRRRAARHAPSLRRARGHRAARGRLGVRRVQGALRHDARLRLREHRRLPGRHRRQQRRAVLGVGAEGRALRGALQSPARAAAVPAEHHRLHGGPQVRGGRHRARRRQDGDGGGLRVGAEVHRDDRRLVRRGQLRDVRARLRRPLPVDAGRTRASR